MKAQELKKIRAETGLSQAAFAELIEYSTASVKKWEQGGKIPARTARHILRAVANNNLTN